MSESSRSITQRKMKRAIGVFIPIALLSLLLAPHSLPMQWVNLFDAEMLNGFESLEFGPVGTEIAAFTLLVEDPVLPDGYRGKTRLVLLEKSGRQFSWPVWLTELALLFLVVYSITSKTVGPDSTKASRAKKEST